VFVHALTVKGKGYEVAELDARKWHGVVPFDLDKQEMIKAPGPVQYTQAFGDAAIECAERDDKVVAITAAMPDGTGLTGFAKRFPDRYHDVGIAEQHAVTFAAGLAAGGLKPFCAIYSTFLQRGFDQVLHDVCIQNLPVRFFMDRAGLVGDDGPTHHGAFDVSYLSFIPNLVLMAPRDATELREMMRFATDYDRGPLAVRYPRGAGPGHLPESRSPIVLGKSETLRSGRHVSLIALGSMVEVAWDVALELEKSGIEAEVINARFAKPLDLAAFAESAQRTGAVVTLEENVRIGGFGQQVRDGLADAGLGGLPFAICALPDAFVEHGTQPLIRKDCGLDAACVAERVQQLLGRKRRR